MSKEFFGNWGIGDFFRQVVGSLWYSPLIWWVGKCCPRLVSHRDMGCHTRCCWIPGHKCMPLRIRHQPGASPCLGCSVVTWRKWEGDFSAIGGLGIFRQWLLNISNVGILRQVQHHSGKLSDSFHSRELLTPFSLSFRNDSWISLTLVSFVRFSIGGSGMFSAIGGLEIFRQWLSNLLLMIESGFWNYSFFSL